MTPEQFPSEEDMAAIVLELAQRQMRAHGNRVEAARRAVLPAIWTYEQEYAYAEAAIAVVREAIDELVAIKDGRSEERAA